MELILTIFACGCDEIALGMPREQDLATVVAVDSHLEQSAHSFLFIFQMFFQKKGRFRCVKLLVQKRRLEQCEGKIPGSNALIRAV